MQYRDFLDDSTAVILVKEKSGDRKISKDEFSGNFIKGLYDPDQIMDIFVNGAPELKYVDYGDKVFENAIKEGFANNTKKVRSGIYDILFNRLVKETKAGQRKDGEIYNALIIISKIFFHAQQNIGLTQARVKSDLAYLGRANVSIAKKFLKDIIAVFVTGKMSLDGLIKKFDEGFYEPGEIKEIFQNDIYYPPEFWYSIKKVDMPRASSAEGADNDEYDEYEEDDLRYNYLKLGAEIKEGIFRIMLDRAMEQTKDGFKLRMPVTKGVYDALDVIVFAIPAAWREIGMAAKDVQSNLDFFKNMLEFAEQELQKEKCVKKNKKDEYRYSRYLTKGKRVEKGLEYFSSSTISR